VESFNTALNKDSVFVPVDATKSNGRVRRVDPLYSRGTATKPIEQETGWVLSQSGHFGEDINLALPGNKPWILGYAVRSLVTIYLFSNKLFQELI
jgi:hypothetical protein